MTAWRAMSSRLAAAPSRVNTSLATSRMRSRLRSASARGLRASDGGGSFVFGICNFRKNIWKRRVSPVILLIGRVSVLSGSGTNVNSGATGHRWRPNSRRTTMRVFVTGATGFIGTELVKELIASGHQVRGLTRSDAGVEQLHAVGAEALRGDLTDLDSLRRGATGMDAVVNLAFNHDWSKWVQNAADEIKAIEALGSEIGR